MRLVLPNMGNDSVASSPSLPRARGGIRATVLLLLVAGRTERLAGAFTSSPVRTMPGLHRPTTRLHVTIEPDDKYAALLQNYQKKKVVVEAAPKITPPEPFAPESVRGAEERLLGLPSTSADLGEAAASAPSSSTSADLAAARAAEEAASRTANAAEEAAAAAARAAEEASAKVTEATSASSTAAAAAKSGGAVAATKGGGATAASSAGTKSISAKVAAGAQAKAAAATAAGAAPKVPTLGEFLKQNVGESDAAEGIKSSISAKIAAGVKAKSAASAATSAAAGAATGKAPTLADYVKDKLANAEIPSKEDLEHITIPNPAPETLANAQEKLGIMKQNLMNELPKVDIDLPKVDLPDLPRAAVSSVTDVASGGVSGGDVAAQVKAAAAAAFAAASGAGDGAAVGSALSDLVATLHLKEYGGWYVAALAALFGASQRSAREEATMRYERELRSLQEKADEAASAAERAAEGARRAKEMVLEKSDGGVLRLQTAERAGTILGKTKMEELQVEREMMRKEMQQLKKGNVQLKAQLDRLFAAQEIEDPLFVNDFDDEDEEIYDEHMTGDADEEDYGNGRILAAMEEIENANASERKAQDEAEKVRAQAKEDEMKLKAQIKAREEAAAAAAKESKGTRSKKSTKASSGEVKMPAKVAHAANSVHPWASLAPSTLGRKTVKELSGFLQEKGVPAVDDSGKPFRKKELLDKVKSLL